jgi:hypothetical protein
MTNSIVNIPRIAGEDLSAVANPVGLLVRVDGTGRVVRTTASTDSAVGVLSFAPNTDVSTVGRAVTVAQLQGDMHLIADAAITAGSIVHATTTAGRVVAVANAAALPANVSGVGIALSAASAAGQPVLVSLGRISK